MNGHGRPIILLRGATALAITAAITVFDPTTAGATQRVSLAPTYTCAFPVIGDQSAPVQIDSSIPDSIAVGQSTERYVVHASATAPWELALGLRLAGVSTITGTAEGRAYVKAPQGDLAQTVHFDIDKITIPAFSSFTGTATGGMPEVTFSEPGRAEIVVGDLTMHLVPRDSSGNLTSLGEMTVPCTLNPGQNEVAASFTITGAPSRTSSNFATADPDSTPTSHSSLSPSSRPSTSAATDVGIAAATTPPMQPTRPADSKPSNAGGIDWTIWLGGLVVLAGIGMAAFRRGSRLWNR